jgi:hypothetical protein
MHRLALLLALGSSCTASGEPPAADAGRLSDARPGAPDARGRADARPSNCLPQVPESWGTPTPFETSYFSDSSIGYYSYFADLKPEGEPFQRLFIALRANRGVFAGGPVTPGTYTLEGDETDYQWCGACVYLAVNDGETPSTLYMTARAKLIISSVSGGQIHGELIGADMRQIEIVFSGDSCPGSGAWPCGNTACSQGRCGVQVEGPNCGTSFDSFTF